MDNKELREHFLKISQELFEAMDFGHIKIVDIEEWEIERYRNGADVSLIAHLDSKDQSSTCRIMVSFYENLEIPDCCTCENECGQVLAKINPKEYFLEKSFKKMSNELKVKPIISSKKHKI